MANLKDPRCFPEEHLEQPDRLIALTLDGLDAGRYTIHEKLLIGRAMFMDEVTRDNQNGKGLETFRIPHSDKKDNSALRCYIEYLHFGIINSKIHDEDESFPYLANLEYELLARAYIIGMNVQDREFQNIVMDALLCRYKDFDEDGTAWLPGADTIVDAYYRTSPSSPLRKFLVDSFMWAGRVDLIKEASENIPEDFWRDLSAALMREHTDRRPNVNIPGSVSCCDYHEHKENDICKSRKQDPAETMDMDQAS